MSVTLSVMGIIKGAVFLAKSTAFKTFLAKCGATIVSKLGVDGTIYAGVTIAAVTGTALTVKDLPQKVIDGFDDLIIGVSECKSAEFYRGLTKLSSSYVTASGLIDDFNEYLKTTNFTIDYKSSLSNSVKEVECLIKAEIENKTYLILKEFDEFLRRKGETRQTYEKQIIEIYHSNLNLIWDSIDYLLGACGRIYSEISSINEELMIKSANTYDHYLVYCIAGYIIDNFKFSCVQGFSQKELANAITNQILDYLHNTGRG